MEVHWIKVVSPKEYVYKTLSVEASDIPLEFLEGDWIQDEIDIASIQVDTEMVARHDLTPLHNQRRDGFIEAIQKGVHILPLILLNSDRGRHYLVDGYARYRALKSLRIQTVQVLRQVA